MSRALSLVPITLLIACGFAPGADPIDVAAAQQSTRVAITGSVVDANLTPLADATLTLEQGTTVRARALSDAQGLFRFAAVEPGQYQLRATRAGFPAYARAVRVPAGYATLRLPVVLVRPEDERVADRSDPASVTAPQMRSGAAPPPLAAMPAPRQARRRCQRPPRAAVVQAAAGRSDRLKAVRNGPRRVHRCADHRERRDHLLPVPSRPSWDPRAAESYARIEPNRFRRTSLEPLSTFGADVDTASYSNVRRFLSEGRMPLADAVRVEELINYFRFDYALPTGRAAMALTTEIGDCPWAPSHKLVLIGARARRSVAREIEGRNIVLLLDVSGSMAPPDRLPLIKSAMGMFVDTLGPDDRVAIVTYAGSSGVALPSTPVRQRETIRRAIDGLTAGGSTNGGQGVVLAYRLARQHFIPGGVNRVILATDGDFNVGIVRQDELLRLIERERESGVFLSVFGVGTGNLRDSTMEMLADKGNGHYAYVDSFQEARRMLVREAEGTLETVAKDVKFQVEFNPAHVAAWKLIGYENRALAAEDFNDDRKDGGEMGAGHTVTVLYEVVPAGADDSAARGDDRPAIDPLRYQPAPAVPRSGAGRPSGTPAAGTDEWLMVKARFKAPEGDVSDVLSKAVRPGGRVEHLPLASTVAEFGLLLRDGPKRPGAWASLVERARRLNVSAGMGPDRDGFVELVTIAAALDRRGHGE